MRNTPRPGRLGKLVYGGCGFVLLALGVLGAVVPGLPSTVFLLAAGYCFARSVPAMERRLFESRWLGASLRRFRETRGMSRAAKAGALISMWVSVGVSALALAATGLAAPLAVVAAGAVGTAVVTLWVPTTVANGPATTPDS